MKTAKLTSGLAIALALLVFAAPASAKFSIMGFDVTSTSTQAGAHPDLTTSLVFAPQSEGIWSLDRNVRELTVGMPPGMVGDPSSMRECTQRQFNENSCPATAQVGLAVLQLAPVGVEGPSFPVRVPIFNMQPRNPDETAELAFSFGGSFTVHLPVTVRSDGDYGLNVVNTGINRPFALPRIDFTVWGVPADSSHDPDRIDMWTLETIEPPDQPRVPFFTNPTQCGVPLDFRAIASSYQEPDTVSESSITLPPLTGCDEFDFRPKLKARPTTDAADAPSGLEVDLAIPQNEDPDGLAEAQLRDATVTLPEGLVVNPSSANGLVACSPGQIGLTTAVGDPNPHFSRAKPTCPAASSLGSVELEVPAFDDPLKGTVYLATPHQNPFGSLLSLYLVVEGHGLVIKLAGKVDADPQTGRLKTTFTENPQQPVEHLRMDLFAGSVAPLRTPADCGTYTTTSSLTPWTAPDSGPPATPTDTYKITRAANGGACGAQPNAPTFTAGSVAPLAGAYQPFVVNLSREDGSQQFSTVTVTPPPGLLAKLAGTATCSGAELATAAAKSGLQEQSAPSCPGGSQVGTVYATAGAGPAPYNAPGKVYLGAPYKGAPLSLAIVTPAVAGPFDLGTIVVRVALFVNPVTAQVTATSDPIPTILQGIPLDVRSVSLRLDRPQFSLNPTSCDPSAVTGSLLSTSGNAAPLQSRFQLGECGRLKFKPKLSLRLKGGTKRAKYPALRAVLKARPGDANIAAASVALPHSEFLAQEHIKTICTRVQYAADKCPAGSIYGSAKAWSPLLDEPLAGPVYLRSSNHALPDLVASLHGRIDIELSGRIDTVNQGIRTNFELVPDAPVSRFELKMRGGKRGLLVNSQNICRSRHRAVASYTSHNGIAYSAKPALKVRCGHKRKPRKR
jgi:hypothetical protein